MSTQSYTKFAVVGSGTYGSHVVEQLATANSAYVRVLSRTGQAKVPAGVDVVAVDYSSEASILTALDGIEVVISTLGGAALGVQIPLSTAAKKAGVKLFVPSEFGNDTTTFPTGLLSIKANLHKHLRDIGLPYVLVPNGLFTDFCFVPFLGFDFAGGKVTIVGDGNTPNSLTAIPDSARFLVHALTTFSPSELENRLLRIQGDRLSFNDLVRIYEETHPGAKIQVTHEDVQAVKERIAADPGPHQFLDSLKVTWDEGQADLGRWGELSNDLWKDWNPITFREYISKV